MSTFKVTMDVQYRVDAAGRIAIHHEAGDKISLMFDGPYVVNAMGQDAYIEYESGLAAEYRTCVADIIEAAE